MLTTCGPSTTPPPGAPSDDRLLPRIDGPEALRSLTAGELARLAGEMREALVTAVSASGGHLGSNLGAVELTLAVHRAFASPHDVVLWDTGHVAYPHKLVTGRADDFATLRRAGGLSGYPSRRESPHDWVENSHASTALGYADGFARSFALRASDRRVVAVIGDGALTGGAAYEAANNIGFYGRRVVVLLNDNGRSYAPTISSLTAGEPGGSDDGDGRHPAGARGFFEALGFAYLGPVDGHDVAATEAALRRARAADGPVLVHALTEKGRGYAPAAAHAESRLHDCAPFPDRAAGPAPRPPGGYTAAFAEALVAAARRSPDVVAVTAAMPGSTGLLGFRAAFPERFVDVGIAEQHAVTSATGMAMGGLRPVVAVYSSFFCRAFDQVNLDVALHGQPVVFALDRAGVTGDDGPSHNGVLDMALCLKVPGLAVYAPSSPADVGPLLDAALASGGPAAIRFPKGPGPRAVPPAVAPGAGAATASRCVRRGDGRVCLVAVGRMVEAATGAAELLAGAGVEATVWDPLVVRPPDAALVADAARHDVVVTVEDGVALGGAGAFLGAAITAAAQADGRAGPALTHLGTPVRFLEHGPAGDILAALGLDAEGVADATRAACARAGVAHAAGAGTGAGT